MANTADSNLSISPFSATVNCGTLTNSWTYKGVYMHNGLILEPKFDYITVDQNLGTIQVKKALPAGTYQIKIIGTYS